MADPETLAEIHRLCKAIAPDAQWIAFDEIWHEMHDRCEARGIPPREFWFMFAFRLGHGIGGQVLPLGEKDQALHLTWNTFMHGAEAAGFDTNSWYRRITPANEQTLEENPGGGSPVFMEDRRCDALAIEVNGRFFYRFGKSGQVLTSWSLAGAELFGSWQEDLIANVEARLARKGKRTHRYAIQIRTASDRTTVKQERDNHHAE